MRFFKENSNIIIKLIINQLGIAIFSIFLYFAAVAFANAETEKGVWSVVDTINVCVSVFSILFYFALIYNAIWEIGAKDKIRIDGGRLEKSSFKGLLIGIFAYIPTLVITGVGLIFNVIYLITNSSQSISNVIDASKTTVSAVGSISGIFTFVLRFFSGMYFGVIQGIGALVAVSYERNSVMDYFVKNVFYILLPLLALAVIHFAYTMGLNDKKIFSSSKPASKR